MLLLCEYYISFIGSGHFELLISVNVAKGYIGEQFDRNCVRLYCRDYRKKNVFDVFTKTNMLSGWIHIDIICLSSHVIKMWTMFLCVLSLHNLVDTCVCFIVDVIAVIK